MRRLIPIVLCSIALAAQAGPIIHVTAHEVDLDRPGALETLRHDNPRHYEAVMKQVDAVQGVEYSDVGLRSLALFTVPDAPPAFGGILEPSAPARARLRVNVEDAVYSITVRITRDPARMVPAK